MRLDCTGNAARSFARTLCLCLAATAFFLQPAVLPAQDSLELVQGTKALYSGQYDRAMSIASKYLETHPRSPSAQILLARAEIAAGQLRPAYEALGKALELDPSNLDALYYLESLSVVLSQEEFQKLLESSPDFYRSHQLMAETYLAQNNREAADREYQAAMRAKPDSVEILDALGDLRRSQYRFDEGLDYYQRAAKLSPHDYSSAYGAGTCYLFQHDTQRAIDSLQRAVAIDPESAAAHLALGDAWLRVGRTETGIGELQAVRKLDPHLRQAYTLLARAYQKLGMTQKAQEALAKDRELAREEMAGAEAENVEEAHRPTPP